jgi:hypothetical protein
MEKNKSVLRFLYNNYVSQKGFALIATLIFVLVLTTLGIVILTMTRSDIKLASLQEESTKAFFLADAGIERALNWLENQQPPPSAEDLPPDKLDGSHPFTELGTGEYRVEIEIHKIGEIEAGYNITSTGYIPNSENKKTVKKLKALVSLMNFAQYAYFSDIETFPNNSAIPLSSSYAGDAIWFTGNDTFGGRVHSNSQLHIVDVPDFYGKVTSTAETIDFYNKNYKPDGSDFPTEGRGFMGEYQLGVDRIDLPLYRNISDLDDKDSLQRITGGSWKKNDFPSSSGIYIPSITIGTVKNATGGIYIKGNVNSINLDVDSNSNSRISITPQSGSATEIISVTEPFNIPSGSTLNGKKVAGQQLIPANTTLTKEPGKNVYTSYEGLPNGVLYVDGAINGLKGSNHKGKMTVVSTQSITISDSIYYNGRDKKKALFDDDIEGIDDSLGLIAVKDVKIASSAPNNIEIDAIIMALNTSFFYEGWNSNLKGNLGLLGGLIQKQRGPVGQHSAGKKTKGYSKEYYFDIRMASPASGYLPPYFPTTGKYEKIWWKEDLSIDN